MAKYRVYGTVTASTYLGEVEAESEEAAVEKALANASVSVCHHCARCISDPEVTEATAELAEAPTTSVDAGC